MNRAVLHELGSRGCDRIEELLEALGVSLRASGKRYTGACPIHGGDSPLAISLYADGDEVKGYWKCRTDNCHDHFPRSLIGFIRGVLSHQVHGWGQGGDPEVGHKAAVNWLCDFLKIDIADVKIDPAEEEHREFRRAVRTLTRSRASTQETLCTREKLRSMMEIPSPYFLARGYSAGTLRTFEVGEVTDRRSPNFGRVIIPVYDDDHDDPIGAISRSVHEKCEECRLCHGDTPCPRIETDSDRMRYLKYATVGRFNDKTVLYNYKRAKGIAREYRCVVVVEGAADVWRLEEGGVRNAVAIFGAEMTAPQQQLLAEIMPRNVVILTDSDEAGDKAARAIEDRCVFANTTRLRAPDGLKDIGSMTAEQVSRVILPAVNEKMRRSG